MYEHVRGTLEAKSPTSAVVDVGGVGFALVIPLTTFEQLPAVGSKVSLLTTLVVREDLHRLYGFATRDERTFFALLQGVSGVGPAVALALVSSMTLEAFQDLVISDDAAGLRRVKGIGKRLSERLVVELRDALGAMRPSAGVRAVPDALMRDAVLALQTLGFKRNPAEQAVRRAREESPELSDPGDLVRRALGHL